MSTATATARQRFLRRTSLHENEYHTNFRKLDRDIISALTSDEASRVTGHMSKIYLSLVNAPGAYWEREGVLRFVGEERKGKCVGAWEQLISLVGVAAATARKAIQWMNEQGIIGYFAGRNGVGIRIFINRAASSIGSKPRQPQKNLRLVRTSSVESHTSKNDTPFNDSFAVREVLEIDLDPRAPNNGAPDKMALDEREPEPSPPPEVEPCASPSGREVSTAATVAVPAVLLDQIVRKIRSEITPAVEAAAQRVAHQEHERTREWLETRGLPKAARVAQREAYNVLRCHGLIRAPVQSSSRVGEVVCSRTAEAAVKPLSTEEIRIFAEGCVALLEAQGRAIDVTLAEMSSEAGGYVLPEDVLKIREAAHSMMNPTAKERGRDVNEYGTVTPT